MMYKNYQNVTLIYTLSVLDDREEHDDAFLWPKLGKGPTFILFFYVCTIFWQSADMTGGQTSLEVVLREGLGWSHHIGSSVAVARLESRRWI